MTSKPEKTHFALMERSRDEELDTEIVNVGTSPLIDSLMNLVSGLLLVLNEHRQIIALNNSFLEMLGIDDAKGVLGIRPGEAIQCIHADLEPGGCGTSEYCASCGAAIAIVLSLAENVSAERKCAISTKLGDKNRELYFRVRAVPVMLSDQRFVVLFLHDISAEQRWAVLERVFFHDVNRVVSGLIATSTLLMERPEKDLAQEVHELSLRVAKEIEIQRSLFYTGVSTYKLAFATLPVSQIVDELKLRFGADVAAQKKTLIFPEPGPELAVRADLFIVTRVLGNMLQNALEASQEGDEIRLSVKSVHGMITFSIWNRQVIPSALTRRIFQRNFTTKEGAGRGLGTYSMKLFGEDILGGKVDFTSSEGVGTRFRLRLRVG